MDKDKKELMSKRAEEMRLRGKKIEDTLDLLKKQIDLLQKDKEDYKKDYINARDEVYKDEVVERLSKELERYRNNSLQVLSDKEMSQFREFKHSHYKTCGTSDVWVLLSPTGIGTGITLKCPKCGEELDITDINHW